ncbi:NAD(P)H-binding protein [Pseudooceanicola sp. MF1-13]|uniref:NAD(P)H-binding protein n=1 Tax=Pseudooceanicola sp. MF1-13 TaxID=3379095 RepID=UPI0038915B3E
MKIVVLGANGRTGKLVVEGALTAGDMVTVVVRSDDKRPSIKHNHLDLVVGDPCNPKFLTQVFKGKDAVISTLGGRTPSKAATSVYWKSADAIVEAAWNAGLRKVAVTSSALLFPRTRLFDMLLATMVRNVVKSATRMEETLERSQLDVIVGRCGFLTNSVERQYRAEVGSLPEDGSTVSRHGLAQFLVDQVRKPVTGLKVYGVSSPA